MRKSFYSDPKYSKYSYLFTSKELDSDTQLYYYGARYYDPRTSVWQSADPILHSYLSGNPSGGVYEPFTLSLYAYGRQNPIIFRDPNGKWFTSKILWLFGKTEHQNALKAVATDRVSTERLQVMLQAQKEIDANQSDSAQYIHAVVGGKMTPEKKAAAIKNANTFVRTLMSVAIDDKKRGWTKQADTLFSFATHTTQDATSPSHKGFKNFSLNWDPRSWWSSAAHVLGETSASPMERAELEGATEWMMDIYQGKASMPKNFFDPKTGELNIPQGYVKTPPAPQEKIPDIDIYP